MVEPGFLYIGDDDDEKRRIKRILTERGLTSFMNNTKWRELCTAIAELPFPPAYQVKLVGQEAPSSDGSYAPGFWGDWAKTWEASFGLYIEWVKVTPRYSKHRGMLISPEIIDCTDDFRSLLKRLRIPYTEADGFFTIYGHGSGIDFEPVA